VVWSKWTGRAGRSVAGVLLLCGMLQGALAQDRRDALTEIERERAAAWRDEQLRRAPASGGVSGLQWLPPVADEHPCFPVERVELVRAAGVPDDFSWLTDDLGQFAGACLGVRSIDALRRNLDARLMARGFVTSSVGVPAQQLGGRVLRLELHLGRVAGIAFPGAPAGTRLPASNALAFGPGDVLNLRAIEQTLENLSRLPSQAAQFQISAGAQPDQSVVQLAFQPQRPWRLSASLDNGAAKEYGRWQMNVQALFDAPLGWSDQLAISAGHALRNGGGERRLDSFMAAYSIPWGYHLLSLTGSRSMHAQPVQGNSVRFREHGYDANVQARWQWTAWRSAAARALVWGGAAERQARNYIDDVELILQRRHTRRLEWGASYWQRLAEAGEVTFDYEAARGRAVGAETDFGLAAPALPRTAMLRAGWQTDFGPQAPGGRWQYEGRVTWQSVHEPANAGDLQLLGSRWSVRGFDAQAFLSGEELTILRQDLRGPWRAAARGQQQLYLALDIGKVGAGGVPPGRTLAGAAAGWRWRTAWAGADLALAVPVHKPTGFAAQSAVAYLNFNFNY